MIPTSSLSRVDRRAGRALRAALADRPDAARAIALGSAAFAPAFRLAVAGAILDPARRASGLRALASASAAAGLARLARDRIGRPRPGARTDGGFPSRHAAAGAAIATSGAREAGRVGIALWGAMAVGSFCRIANGEHEPGDVLAGAAIGVLAASALEVAWKRAR